MVSPLVVPLCSTHLFFLPEHVEVKADYMNILPHVHTRYQTNIPVGIRLEFPFGHHYEKVSRRFAQRNQMISMSAVSVTNFHYHDTIPLKSTQNRIHSFRYLLFKERDKNKRMFLFLTVNEINSFVFFRIQMVMRQLTNSIRVVMISYR